MFVCQSIRYGSQVALCVRHQNILCLCAIDRIAKSPSAHRLISMALTSTILSGIAVLGGIGREAWADSASNDTLPLLVALDVGSKLFDDPNRLVPHRQSGGDRVFTLEDVYISTADCGGGDAHQRIVRTNFGDALFLKLNFPRRNKHGSFHGFHHGLR